MKILKGRLKDFLIFGICGYGNGYEEYYGCHGAYGIDIGMGFGWSSIDDNRKPTKEHWADLGAEIHD